MIALFVSQSQELQEDNKNWIIPTEVCRKLQFINVEFVLGTQQDAHEYLVGLLSKMKEAFMAPFKSVAFEEMTTPFHQILGWLLKSEVRCLGCDHVSEIIEYYEDIAIPAHAESVEEAINAFFGCEEIDKRSCEVCKKEVEANKQYSVEQAPIEAF